MAVIELNFRETDGGIDTGGQTAVLDGPSYPTSSGGDTFGVTSGGNLSRTRGATDPRCAGFLANSNATAAVCLFRIDLGTSGVKNIRLAIGDSTNDSTGALYIQVRDDSTPLITITDADGYTAGQFYDAAGTLHTSVANWVANNAAVEVEFSTTTCIIALGNGTRQGFISHIEIEDAAPADAITAIDNPILDGETGNSATVTGFASGDVNSVTIDGVAALNVSETDNEVTFDNIDISAVTADEGTVVPNFGEVTVAFSNGTESANTPITISPKAGYEVVTLSGLDTEDPNSIYSLMLDQLEIEIADGWEYYGPTANNSTMSPEGFITTDDLDGYDFILIDRTGSDLAYPVSWFNVVGGGGEVSLNRVFSRSLIKSFTRGLI